MHIPVLAYHSVSNDKSPISISTNCFEKQIIFLKKLSYETVNFDEIDPNKKNQIILTFDDGYKDIVINAESGFLIEPYNCKKMAKTIENYLKDEKKISKLSKASRYNALNNFNYKKVAESHLRLYKQVLDYGKSEFNK